MHQHISTLAAGFRLLFAKRSTAGQAGGLPDRICRPTIITGYARQPFGQLLAGSGFAGYPGNYLPDFIIYLQVGYVLRNIIQPA